SWISGGGNLGIGTNSPSAPLTVSGAMRSVTAGYGTFLEMVNEEENNALQSTGLGNLYFRMNGQDNMWLNTNGDLWINGALRTGNITSGGSDGMIKYTGSDLYGKVNGIWKSLTQSGGYWTNISTELRPSGNQRITI